MCTNIDLEPPDLELLAGSLLFLQDFNPSILIWLIAILVLLICSALISGSEVAFFSLSPAQLDEVGNGSSSEDKKLNMLLGKQDELLATILISNNLVNVAIIVLSTVIIDGIIDFEQVSGRAAFLIQVVAVTFLILLAGEVLPKVYASTHNLKMARVMSLPLSVLLKIFSPLSAAMISLSTFLNKHFKSSSELTVGHLEHAVAITKDENSSDEHKILEGIVKFGNTDVKQVMTPRVSTFALDIETPYSELIKAVEKQGYSRIPVYEGDLDNLRGVLYIKDLIPYIGNKKMNWQKLIHEPFFVPESKKIDDLLTQFQKLKKHLAIVVDEYGGTSGIITLEDVIEEIVGDITDEFDTDDINYTKVDDNNYILEGKIPLVDLYRILDIDGEEFESVKAESDTLAGFIIELAGKIPLKNEQVTFNDFLFTVEAADKRKVRQVKVTLLTADEE